MSSSDSGSGSDADPDAQPGSGSAPPVRRAVAMFATVLVVLVAIALFAWYVGG